jgi:hypothetical protein
MRTILFAPTKLTPFGLAVAAGGRPIGSSLDKNLHRALRSKLVDRR